MVGIPSFCSDGLRFWKSGSNQSKAKFQHYSWMMSCSVNRPRDLQSRCSSSERPTSTFLLSTKGRQRFCVSLPAVDHSQCGPPRWYRDGSRRSFQPPRFCQDPRNWTVFIKTHPSQALFHFPPSKCRFRPEKIRSGNICRQEKHKMLHFP